MLINPQIYKSFAFYCTWPFSNLTSPSQRSASKLPSYAVYVIPHQSRLAWSSAPLSPSLVRDPVSLQPHDLPRPPQGYIHAYCLFTSQYLSFASKSPPRAECLHSRPSTLLLSTAVGTASVLPHAINAARIVPLNLYNLPSDQHRFKKETAEACYPGRRRSLVLVPARNRHYVSQTGLHESLPPPQPASSPQIQCA